MKNALLFIVLFIIKTSGQNIQYYVQSALQNSPILIEAKKNIEIAKLQNDIDYAQNSGYQISVTANYLFAPFFHNNGGIISTNPSSDAIGYDVGITNGGEYSALLNVEKNVYLGPFNKIYNVKNEIRQKKYSYNYEFEKHQLQKEITDQYLNAFKSLKLYALEKETAENLKTELNIYEELVKKGYNTIQNYLQLKIEYQNRQIKLEELYQQYVNELYQLNTLAGITDTNVVMLNSVKIELITDENPGSFIKKYKLDSLETLNDEAINETKYIPKISLFFNTGLNAIEVNNIERKFGLSAGINFSYLIFDGNQSNLMKQQNEVSLEIIKSNANYARDSIRIQKKNSLKKVNLYLHNLETMENQINDYEKLINLSVSELNDGNISMIDYLAIIRDYLDFKRNLIEKGINYLMEVNNYNYWNW